MPFTQEQEAFIIKAYYRSGTRNEDGSWSYSLQSCIAQFNEEYPNVDVPYKTFARQKERLINRFENKSCICKAKPPGRTSEVNDEIVEDIRGRIERSPHKSVRKLSFQSGVSYGTCRRILKKELHMHPYKITVTQQLLPLDYNARILYCQWFNNNLRNDDVLDLTFYSDEAWFHLSGYVNSQNYRTWAADNPHVFVETSLHPIKIGIWVAISRRRIIGPIFFTTR